NPDKQMKLQVCAELSHASTPAFGGGPGHAVHPVSPHPFEGAGVMHTPPQIFCPEPQTGTPPVEEAPPESTYPPVPAPPVLCAPPVPGGKRTPVPTVPPPEQ